MDYSKTLIYKIEHIEDDSLVYVGHTTNWDKRKSHHKHCCNNEKTKQNNLKLYQMMRQNGGWNNFKMIEVEKYPCNDKREAEKRECEVMKELKAIMNTNKSYLSKEDKELYVEEYYENNKEQLKDYIKDYYENIKDKIKEYYENNKDKIKEYYENNKDKIKEYYENNKDKIKNIVNYKKRK